MASNSHTELEGGVMGLFVQINTNFLVYKQLSRHNSNNVVVVQYFETQHMLVTLAMHGHLRSRHVGRCRGLVSSN